MKKTILTSLLMASAVFAHGPVAEQASMAVSAATKMFLATHPKDTTRLFSVVSGKLTGHERFEIVITLKDETTHFKFECIENEDVEPAIWECRAL